MSRLFPPCYATGRPGYLFLRHAATGPATGPTTGPATGLGAGLGARAGGYARRVTDTPTTSSPDAGVEPVSLARRFGALMIDWILCLLASGVIGRPVQYPWAAPLVLVLEYALFVGVFTQTPGMWINRIRCVSTRDGGRIGVLRAALRGLLLALVLPALFMDSDRRGLHDRVVDSVVVRA